MRKVQWSLVIAFLLFVVPAFAGDVKNGLYRQFYANGQLKSETQIKNGQVYGVYKEYFENGKLAFIQNVRGGRVNGKVKAYYESGKLKGEVNYINSLQDGKAIEYYESGKVKEITIFIEGQIINIKKFDEKGRMISNQNDNFGVGCVFYEEAQS